MHSLKLAEREPKKSVAASGWNVGRGAGWRPCLRQEPRARTPVKRDKPHDPLTAGLQAPTPWSPQSYRRDLVPFGGSGHTLLPSRQGTQMKQEPDEAVSVLCSMQSPLCLDSRFCRANLGRADSAEHGKRLYTRATGCLCLVSSRDRTRVSVRPSKIQARASGPVPVCCWAVSQSAGRLTAHN